MKLGRVLIVEDALANVQVLASVLSEAGYAVSVATSGKQALKLLESVVPDLILLDVMMVGMDGFETCERIKAVRAWRDVPIIFLTGQTETVDVVRGFDLGAVDYVGKPFNRHELLARVNTHVTLHRLNRENRRLLLNVLPESVADRLKQDGGLVAERFEDVSVLFADIVGFTRLSVRLSPTDLLELLNVVFSRFDAIADEFRVEKIKTIGDAYMAAGGLVTVEPDHLASMVGFAAALQESVGELRAAFPGLQLRIGIHTGPCVAGVIGIRKFSYDIWGDTVNTASRLESQGEPGRIHVSDAVFERLEGRFKFESRGVVELRGRGSMNTYFVAQKAG